MKQKAAVIFFMLIITLAAQGQNGSLYLTHFQDEYAENLQIWSIARDSSNNMFFANRKGILRYNGGNWNLIKTPVMPYTMHRWPGQERIYIGADQDIGYLRQDSRGFYHYQSLSPDKKLKGEFINIEPVDSVLYFMSTRSLIRVDPQDPSRRRTWQAGKNEPFTGLIHNDEHVFVNLWNKGLHRLQKDTLFPIVSGFWTKNQEILFSLPHTDERLILGTDDNKLYLFDGMKFYNFRLKNQSYLEESILAGARNISGRHFALFTLAGGVLVVDKTTREIDYTINYQTGLPDDEVQALGLDRNQGLWISHADGISRADLTLPVKNFSSYPGLEGNLINALEMDSTLYLATGEGLYYLAKEKKYREQEITVRVEEEVPVEPRPKAETQTSPPEEDPPVQTEPEEKPENKIKPDSTDQEKEAGAFKKFFNKIFGKKEEESPQETKPRERPPEEPAGQEKQTTPGRASERPTPEPQTQTRVSYKKKKIYSLQSVSHRYKKVEGLEGKVERLLPFAAGFLASTHDGLYYINQQKEVAEILSGTYPLDIIPYKQRGVLIATRSGILQVNRQGDDWSQQQYLPEINEPVYSMAYNKRSGSLWAGAENKAYRIALDWSGEITAMQSYSLPSEYSERYRVRMIEDNPHLFLSTGIYQYKAAPDTFAYRPRYKNDSLSLSDYQYILSHHDVSWIKNNGYWQTVGQKPQQNQTLSRFLRLFENIQNLSLSRQNHLWVIEDNQLYRVDLNEGIPDDTYFRAYFSSIRSGDDHHFRRFHLDIHKENTPLEFRIAAPQYLKQEANQYQYKIEGLMEDWSQWSDDPTIRIFAQKGEYTVIARARNIWGQINQTRRIHYQVPPPFTETRMFYGLLTLGVGGLLFMMIKLRERKLKRDKRTLEEAVRQRTATIEEQKAEIATQRDEILQQKNTIERKNEEITGSIEYAWRIQTALLPKQEQFNHHFSDHFILFKPRSIVSGDFYWIHQNDGKIFVTAADCTGHGVPGAFMSMLGISYLNEIVGNSHSNHKTAADILNQLRQTIKNSLHQTGKRDLTKDGMDMAFCIIDKNKMTLDFAGAFNPLYLFRNGTFEKHLADRMPVGIYHTEKATFTNHHLDLHPGDTLYLFSDGYIDQLGGPDHKKFKSKNFVTLLQDIYTLPMDEQKKILEEQFETWKGQNFQVDDVIVLGLKI
jgi:serine phosphatase RsbU (regulator of sigma subunit)/ligand-binding sensor domain-containing protein